MLPQYFGAGFTDLSIRQSYYEHTEMFIRGAVKDWTTPPDTDDVAARYWALLQKMRNEELAFLVLVSGYIPEFYEEDSSQETLYSKLVEIIVTEWGIRSGFSGTQFQKQKSSKEDVTLKIAGSVIVCDAKTYRLGRSQAAPNVKDTLKKADYEKWLEYYPLDERVGGIITFPSLFRWKGKSDAYLYCTDHKSPIALTLYEHLAFYLIKKLAPSVFIDHLKNYARVFPTPTKVQMEYFTQMDKSLFGPQYVDWQTFKRDTAAVLQERVDFSKTKIGKFLIDKKAEITKEVAAMNPDQLRPKLITSMYANECSQLERQLGNISKFRKPGTDI